MKAKVVEGKEEAGAKFSDYFNHSEKWSTFPAIALWPCCGRAMRRSSRSKSRRTPTTHRHQAVERIVAGEYQSIRRAALPTPG